MKTYNAINMESITFIIFVISILWIAWVPMSHYIGNIKSMDFDNKKDLYSVAETFRKRTSRPIGKAALIYIIFYIAINIVRFLYNMAT